MSNLGRLKPKYISIGMTNDTDIAIDASIHQDYGVAVINKLDNYVVCIERLEINLNAIPFYKANPLETGNESILFFTRADHVNPIGGYVLTKNYYSLFEIFEDLNSVIFNITMTLSYTVQIEFGLDEVGRIVLTLIAITGFLPFTSLATDWSSFYIVFPTYLNMIMGFNKDNFAQAKTEGPPGAWGATVRSTYPQIDCGDNLNHIIITSSLPVISDSIDVVQANVLTDICPVSNYTPETSYPENTYRLAGSGWSLNTRQKLIYIPTERRYLDLIAPFSMRYIQIDAFYMTNNMTSTKVQLPPGGTFQIKLGFYQK